MSGGHYHWPWTFCGENSPGASNKVVRGWGWETLSEVVRGCKAETLWEVLMFWGGAWIGVLRGSETMWEVVSWWLVGGFNVEMLLKLRGCVPVQTYGENSLDMWEVVWSYPRQLVTIPVQRHEVEEIHQVGRDLIGCDWTGKDNISTTGEVKCTVQDDSPKPQVSPCKPD